MEKLIRAISYDNDNPNAYPEVPEFGRPLPADVVYVSQGRYRVGDAFQTYASEGFAACSGFLIRGEASTTFGLLHALPMQDLYPDDFEQLKSLSGGQVILIEGSSSSPKTWILRDLERRLGIQHVETLSLDTRRSCVGNMHFHLAFRPRTDEILLARNSHKDLLVFPGFNSGQS